MVDKRIRYEHESFGTLRFSRVQMPETPLFGSSILHHEGVIMEVHTADRDRQLSTDWIHSDKLLLRLMLSTNWFVDNITRLNQGLGAPATIEYVAGDDKQHREWPPPPEAHTEFQREAEEGVEELVRSMDDLIGSSKGSVRRKAESVKQQLVDNLPFINRQLKRQMDRTVTEAKMEFEAHVTVRLEELGLEALRDRMPQLPDALECEKRQDAGQEVAPEVTE